MEARLISKERIASEMHAPRMAIPTDFPLWLNLTREVEPLFGPMVEDPVFRKSLMLCIQEKHAFCVSDEDHTNLLGGILIDPKENEILWLAVTRKARGRGIGQALLIEALANLDLQRSVFVQTYDPSIPDGRAAVLLYEKAGFSISRDAGDNPAGISTVIMSRPPSEISE